MSSPQLMPQPANSRASLQAEQKRKAERRSDLFYFAGAALVTVGVAWYRLPLGLIAAGCFLLLPPLLELASSFIRGMRSQMRSR